MSTRPRGFMPSWQPRAATTALLDSIDEIVEDVVPQVGAITLRQLFYLLVTRAGYDKTERAYKRLCECANKARRAGLLDMDHIRDDGSTVIEQPNVWESAGQFRATVRRQAATMRLERQDDQAQYVVLWCEAAGMAPQLAAAVGNLGVPVLSSGGFDSLTFKHDQARIIADRDVPTVVLHVGDRDPSGEHLHMSLAEDVGAFVEDLTGDEDWFRLERIAVTEEQVERLNLPTAPPKRTDRRSFDGDATTQAEAIEPAELRRIVQEAVQEFFDDDTYAAVLAREHDIRDQLTEALA